MRCRIYLGWCLLLTLIITNKLVASSEDEADVSNDIEDPPPAVDDENPNNTCENPEHPECQPVESIPLISLEELGKYNGKVKGDKIYLSILGEVYEVTNGPEFYAEGAGYHTFAGREAAVPFISGKFTEEEAEKSTDVLTDVEVFSLKTWLDFYKNEKRYSYVGRVIGRFYNADGVPTEELLRVRSRWEAFQPEEPKKRKKPKGT